MLTEKAKDAFKEAEEKYNKQVEEFKEKGVEYVPWNIFRTVRVYLHNKQVDVKCKTYLAEDHYQVIVINGYDGEKYLGTCILLPDDTESKAYGKVDKYIVNKTKEVK